MHNIILFPSFLWTSYYIILLYKHYIVYSSLILLYSYCFFSSSFLLVFIGCFYYSLIEYFLYHSSLIVLSIARFSSFIVRFSCFLPPTSLQFDATRLDPGSEGNAQSKPQIHNLPFAMRIIIEYQKLCYSLFHSARLLPARPFREDA